MEHISSGCDVTEVEGEVLVGDEMRNIYEEDPSAMDMESGNMPPSIEIEIHNNPPAIEVEVEDNPPVLEIEIVGNPLTEDVDYEDSPPDVDFEGEDPGVEGFGDTSREDEDCKPEVNDMAEDTNQVANVKVENNADFMQSEVGSQQSFLGEPVENDSRFLGEASENESLGGPEENRLAFTEGHHNNTQLTLVEVVLQPAVMETPGDDERSGREMEAIVSLEKENVGSTNTANLEKCLICLKPVSYSILNREQSPTSSMVLLSKIFKVTKTMYNNIDLSVLHSPLYCASCSKSLNNALNILRDIKTLENKLNLLADDLKIQLLSSYRKPKKSTSKVAKGQNPTHDEVCGQLRSTFAQCWSDCVVGVPRVEKKSSVREALTPTKEKLPVSKVIRSERIKKRLSNRIETLEQVTKKVKMERTQIEKPPVTEDDEDPIAMADDPADEDYFPDLVEAQEDTKIEPDLDQESQLEVVQKKRRGRKAMKRKAIIATRRTKLLKEKEKPKHLNLGVMKFNKDQLGGKQYPYSCEKCGKGYLQKHFLDAHIQSHDGKLKFSCIICSKEFSLERHLRLHEVNGHRLPSTNARKVQKRRFNHEDESMNIYTKNGILLGFTCEHCKLKFVKSDFVTEDGKFRHVCNYHPGCEKEFFVFSVFRTHHEKTCPSRPAELVHCDDCGRDFSSAKVLQDHRTSFHTKQYEFYCELCGLGMCNRGTLNRHMICHTDEKQHQCPICDHRFKRKMQLTYHMRKHNRESLLMCGTCGKTFANPQDLKNHELIHTNEKQFPCKICNKMFTTRNYVYTHVWATHKKARQPRQVRSNRDRLPKIESDPDPAVIPDGVIDYQPENQ